MSIDRKKVALPTRGVKRGDVLVFPYWGKADNVKKDSVTVTTVGSNPITFDVRGEPLIKGGYSADFFKKEVQITKTEAAELLSTSFNVPFTVNFDKSNGQNRTLRGRLVEPERLMGRSHVEDLDVKKGTPLRLVDHRSIHWIIINCTKYVVKGK